MAIGVMVWWYFSAGCLACPICLLFSVFRHFYYSSFAPSFDFYLTFSSVLSCWSSLIGQRNRVFKKTREAAKNRRRSRKTRWKRGGLNEGNRV
jgi:hypothetical protein